MEQMEICTTGGGSALCTRSPRPEPFSLSGSGELTQVHAGVRLGQPPTWGLNGARQASFENPSDRFPVVLSLTPPRSLDTDKTGRLE